jgi:hypothetical protein
MIDRVIQGTSELIRGSLALKTNTFLTIKLKSVNQNKSGRILFHPLRDRISLIKTSGSFKEGRN